MHIFFLVIILFSKTKIYFYVTNNTVYYNIILTKTAAPQNEVARSYHIVRGLYCLAVVSGTTMVSFVSQVLPSFTCLHAVFLRFKERWSLQSIYASLQPHIPTVIKHHVTIVPRDQFKLPLVSDILTGLAILKIFQVLPYISPVLPIDSKL